MNSSEWINILSAAGVLLACALSIYGVWRALFRDRPAGRRRCPRCWHDLSRTTGLTCGECGFAATDERQLHRTRRHWPLAVLSLIACALAIGWSYWTLADRGWRSLVPSRAIMIALPVIGVDGPLYDELERRASRNQLTAAQWNALLRSAAAGDWWSRPTEDDWITKYGNLISIGRWRYQATPGMAWDEGVHATLLAIPPRVDLRSRSEWPTGSSPTVHVNLRDWWPRGATSRIRLTPDVGSLSAPLIYRTGERIPWAGHAVSLHDLDADARSVSFEIVVERRTEDDAATWQPMLTDEITLPIRYVELGSLDLPASDDTALTEAVWQTFAGGAVRWESGDVPVRFYFRAEPTRAAEFRGLAVGAHVDVMHHERIARRLDIWWLAGRGEDDRGIGWESHDEDPALLESIGIGDGWTMRVTSDPALALRAGDASGYWEGDIAFPLRLRTRNGDAPERLWWTEEDGAEKSDQATKRPGD